MDFEPVHGSNNLVKRWIGNWIFEPLATLFLRLYMRWGTMYTADFEEELEDDN